MGNRLRQFMLVAFVAVSVFFTTGAAVVSVAADDEQGGICAATVTPDLLVDVPRFTFDDAGYFASFQVAQMPGGSYGAMLTAFGETTRTDCLPGDSGVLLLQDGSLILHIPSLLLGPDRYWVNLVYVPTSDGNLWFLFPQVGLGVEGLSGEGSAFLSLSEPTVTDGTETLFNLLIAFPGGMEGDASTTLLPDQTYTPTPEEIDTAAQLDLQVYGEEFSHSESGDSFQFRLEYFLPYAALPPGMAPAIPRDEMKSGTAKAGGAESGFQAVFESVLKSADKKALQNLAEMGFGEAGKAVVKIGGTVLDVFSAWDVRKEHQGLIDRLNKARECAENPEVPYADPGAKQVVLDTIDAAERELKMHTAVRFVNKEVGVAAGLVSAPIWPIVAGEKGYTEDTLKKLSELEVQRAEKLAPCPKSYRASGGNGISISGTICSLSKPFSLTGVTGEGGQAQFSYTPSSKTAGAYTYTYSAGGFQGSGNGNYTVRQVVQGNNDTLTMTQTDTGCIAGIPDSCATHTSTITLTAIASCAQ